jgi:hypothetical protein
MPGKLSNTAKRATSKGLSKKSPGFKGKISNTAKRSTSKTTGVQSNDRKFSTGTPTTMDIKGQGAAFGKGVKKSGY